MPGGLHVETGFPICMQEKFFAGMSLVLPDSPHLPGYSGTKALLMMRLSIMEEGSGRMKMFCGRVPVLVSTDAVDHGLVAGRPVRGSR